jgi:hypothetical protein
MLDATFLLSSSFSSHTQNTTQSCLAPRGFVFIPYSSYPSSFVRLAARSILPVHPASAVSIGVVVAGSLLVSKAVEGILVRAAAFFRGVVATRENMRRVEHVIQCRHFSQQLPSLIAYAINNNEFEIFSTSDVQYQQLWAGEHLVLLAVRCRAQKAVLNLLHGQGVVEAEVATTSSHAAPEPRTSAEQKTCYAADGKDRVLDECHLDIEEDLLEARDGQLGSDLGRRNGDLADRLQDGRS